MLLSLRYVPTAGETLPLKLKDSCWPLKSLLESIVTFCKQYLRTND